MAEGGWEHKYKSGGFWIYCFTHFTANNRSQIDHRLNFLTIPENYCDKVKEPCLTFDRDE